MMQEEYFASCSRGLEGLLQGELLDLGAETTRETAAGVYFTGSIKTAYYSCLWSRLANKILLPLGHFTVTGSDSLYEAVYSVAWEAHISPASDILVDFSGSNQEIRHSQFGAMRVKDALVDRLRHKTGQRPSVSTDPNIRINAHLSRDRLVIGLDLCGHSLHRRGYRIEQGAAPLKENLAAALLIRAGWPDIAASQGALLDPMCGSGTLLIEGACMAADIAPGLLKIQTSLISEKVQGYSLVHWLHHDKTVWHELIQEAKERSYQGLARDLPEIRGYDNNPHVLDKARANIECAGLDDCVRLSHKSVAEFRKPTHKLLQPGLMICNPPYGERLGEKESLMELYQELGQVAKRELEGWRLGVFSSDGELASALRLRVMKKYKFFNGTIPTSLYLYTMVSAVEAQLPTSEFKRGERSVKVAEPKELSDGAQMLVNRLQKNRKKLSSWIKRQDIECYRIYDADIPEYSAAIDVYGEYLHIQEYAAPKTVDAHKAHCRLQEILMAAQKVFGLGDEKISLKTRRKNPGKQQYQKQHTSVSQLSLTVTEGQAKFWVDLETYLDTGLFLDHRPLREKLFREIQGKSFLNLFCYTATATVQAALGGAAQSVSVDMSNTYLDWARKNFVLNNIDTRKHKLVRMDCIAWLKNCRSGFDCIMLDPPSFSNSKKMQGVLDTQRDHVDLVIRCMEILNPMGTLYFSTNRRSFRLDREKLSRYDIGDITDLTLDPDFKSQRKIHRCWKIEHRKK